MSSNQIRRPSFYEGQYLGAADLTTAIDYGRIEDARHALGAHTWGIAAGLEITEKDSAAGGGQVDVFIQPGYAWDGYGRPVVVLAPTKISAELFKSIAFNVGDDGGTPPGHLVKVWLRYDESATQSPGPGFAQCGGAGEFARIGETFRIEIGEQQGHDGHAEISVAGHIVDAKDILQTLNPPPPPVPPATATPIELFDESVPYQDLPIDNPRARWLIPLGEVRWLPNTNAAQAGNFVKRTPVDLNHSRRLRRHVGVVAAAVEAVDGLIRLHDRTKPYSAAFTQSPELVWVEGDLRVRGDARLFDGKLAFRNQTGVDNGDDPLYFSRRDATAASSLRAVIGKKNTGANTFAVGRLNSSAVFEPLLTVRDNGMVGIGTDTPPTIVGIEHPTEAFLTLKATSTGNPTLLVGADSNGGIVSTMSHHDLHLRAGTNAEKVTIKADGKVGIGTSAPTGTLTLQGFVQPQHGKMTLFSQTADMEYDGGSDGLFIFRDTGGKTAFMGGNVGIGTINPVGRLTIDGVHQPQQGSLTFFSASADFEYDGGSDGVFIFKDTGGKTAFMGGNVGIGTTSPAGRLTIDGVSQPQQGSLTFFSASADFEYDGGSDGVFIFKDTGGSTAFMGGNVGIGTTSPSRLLHVEGTLFVNGQARKPGGGSWTNSSDLELKKDVNTITDALDQLLRLRGVRFFWKEPEKMGNLSGLQRGLVAQEVENVFPEWVEEGPEGYKELTIVGFEALVVEALRELQSAIDGINQRLDTLEPQSTTTKKKKSDTAT